MEFNHNHEFQFFIISFFSLTIFSNFAQSSSSSPSPSPSQSFDLAPGSSQILSTENFKIQSTDETDTDRINTPLTQMLKQEDPATNIHVHPLLFSSLKNGTKIDPIIEKICQKTDYPDLCISSISPLFNGRADPIAVLEISIKACADYAKLTMGVAKSLIHLPTTSQETASVLGDCTDFFSDAFDNLQAAANAIVSRDIGTINTMLSAAISDFVTCEDEFEGESSPMADYDNKLSNMASNCLAFASLI